MIGVSIKIVATKIKDTSCARKSFTYELDRSVTSSTSFSSTILSVELTLSSSLILALCLFDAYN